MTEKKMALPAGTPLQENTEMWVLFWYFCSFQSNYFVISAPSKSIYFVISDLSKSFHVGISSPSKSRLFHQQSRPDRPSPLAHQVNGLKDDQ